MAADEHEIPDEREIKEGDPGVFRVNFGFVGGTDPETEAALDRLEEAALADRRRRALRDDVPSARKPPERGEPLRVVDGVIPFPPSEHGGVSFALANIAIYVSGVAFELVARGQSPHGELLSDRVNVSHRLKDKRIGRSILSLTLPDWEQVTNLACMVADAPDGDDEETPWLYGGGSYGRAEETGAEYFLSPRPRYGGTVEFRLVYGEVGIYKVLSISLDSETFRPR